MKRVVVIMMLALCVIGCRNNQKKVYTQSDVREDLNVNNKDVDWIGLYIRCHELDSLKNIAEAAAEKNGTPMPALPDSVTTLWQNMLNEILLRQGDIAFGIYDTHRPDIESYLRLDFINYGFITKVYLPYAATVNTREKYGEICIKELEEAMSKAEMTKMYGGYEPSHYEDVLRQLYFAYVNYDKYDQAAPFCDIVLSYLRDKYGDESIEYANMLNNKANMCNNMGSGYSAMIAGKRAVSIYEKLLRDPNLDHEEKEKIAVDKLKLEDKLKLWQGQ